MSFTLHRQSNFELLRIVSIFMVVFSHFFVHSGFPYTEQFSVKNLFIGSFAIGEIGVVCFVLLSGYFLINMGFSLKKLLKFSFQLWFYGIFILIFAWLFNTAEITNKYFWGSITPFYSLNWFAKAYLLLYLLVPVINYILKRISKKTFECYLLVFGLLWTVLPALDLYEHGNIRITVIYIYTIGAYIRIYGINILKSFYSKVILGVVSYIAIMVSVAVMIALNKQYTFISGHETGFLALNSFLVIMTGISIFLVFKELQIRYNEKVNLVAKTVFGVYLIHDNPLIRQWLWENILHTRQFYDSYYLFVYAFICTILIFIVCGSMDYCRIKVIEKPVFRIVDRYLPYYQNLFRWKVQNWIFRIIERK